MASLKNAYKRGARIHRERHQPSFRKHLGILPKHKDYVVRSQHYHRRKKKLNHLRKEAESRNPDEFYFGMLHHQLKDGKHIINREKLSNKSIKILKKQDLLHLQHLYTKELNKVQKLNNTLGILDPDLENNIDPSSHIIYPSDSDEDIKNDYSIQNPQIIKDDQSQMHKIKKSSLFNEISIRKKRITELKKLMSQTQLHLNLMAPGSKYKLKQDNDIENNNDNDVFSSSQHQEIPQSIPVYYWKSDRKK